jgi:hypothetical protein
MSRQYELEIEIVPNPTPEERTEFEHAVTELGCVIEEKDTGHSLYGNSVVYVARTNIKEHPQLAHQEIKACVPKRCKLETRWIEREFVDYDFIIADEGLRPDDEVESLPPVLEQPSVEQGLPPLNPALRRDAEREEIMGNTVPDILNRLEHASAGHPGLMLNMLALMLTMKAHNNQKARDAIHQMVDAYWELGAEHNRLAQIPGAPPVVATKGDGGGSKGN